VWRVQIASTRRGWWKLPDEVLALGVLIPVLAADGSCRPGPARVVGDLNEVEAAQKMLAQSP